MALVDGEVRQEHIHTHEDNNKTSARRRIKEERHTIYQSEEVAFIPTAHAIDFGR